MRLLAALLILCLPIALTDTATAQRLSPRPSLVGTWEGEFVLGRDDMNLAFTFTIDQGQYSAALISSAMGIFGMPAESVTIDGLNVKIKISRLDVEFYGTLRLAEDGVSILRIDGDYYQQSEMVQVVLLPVASPSF